MILKYYCFLTTLVLVPAQKNSPVELVRYDYVLSRKAPDHKQVYSDVVQNISQVNDILEDLIDNYSKLKSMYRSREAVSEDLSSDVEMDEVFKQRSKDRKQRIGHHEILETTTKNPDEIATEMFFSEEKAHSEGGDYNETDYNNSENEKSEIDEINPEINTDTSNIITMNTTKTPKKLKDLNKNKFKNDRVIYSGDKEKSSTIPKRFKKVVNKENTEQAPTEFQKEYKEPNTDPLSNERSESRESNKETQKTTTKKQESKKNRVVEAHIIKPEQYDEDNSGSQEVGLEIPEKSYEEREVELDLTPSKEHYEILEVHVKSNEKSDEESQEPIKNIRYDLKQKISQSKKQNKRRPKTEKYKEAKFDFTSSEKRYEIQVDRNKRSDEENQEPSKNVRYDTDPKKYLPKKENKKRPKIEKNKMNKNEEQKEILSESQELSDRSQENIKVENNNKHGQISVEEINPSKESESSSQIENNYSSKFKQKQVYNGENNHNFVSKIETVKNYEINPNTDRSEGVNEEQILSIIGPQSRFKVETRPILTTEVYVALKFDPIKGVSKDQVLVESDSEFIPSRPSYVKKVVKHTPANYYPLTGLPTHVNRYVKKVVQAEDFSKVNIWDEVIHKPITLHTENEVVYKQPRIYFRDQFVRDIKNDTLNDTLNTDSQVLRSSNHTSTANEMFNRTEGQEGENSSLFNDSTILSANKTRRTKKELGNSSIESDDDHKLVQEQFQTRVLRKAYGDACLKVVVRKCWKACKAAFKDTCVKYSCGKKFKDNFLGNAKTSCIREFTQEMGAAMHRNGESLVNSNFHDLTRNGYLAAVCLPVARQRMPLPSNTSFQVSGPEIKMNILRDRFEKACQKASAEKCENACDQAGIKTCENMECQGNKLAYLKKQCHRDCKKSYRGKKGRSIKDTSNTSSGDSGSKSRSTSKKRHKERKKHRHTNSKKSKSSSSSSSSSSGSSGSSESDTDWSDMDKDRHHLLGLGSSMISHHKSHEKEHKSCEHKHKSDEKKYKSHEKKHKSHEKKHKSDEKKHKSVEKKQNLSLNLNLDLKSDLKTHKSDEKKHKSNENKHKSNEKKHKSDEKKHKSDEKHHKSDENKHKSVEKHKSEEKKHKSLEKHKSEEKKHKSEEKHKSEDKKHK